MVTFYVLPSRQFLGGRFGEMLAAIFPESAACDAPELAARLARIIEEQGSAFVVFREDLDNRLSVKDSLLRDFGAALDDGIVEVNFGAGLYEVVHQHWATESLKLAG